MVERKHIEVKVDNTVFGGHRPPFFILNTTEGIATPLKVLLDPFFGENRWQYIQIPIGIPHT
jgi:hypothetical protein